jgi:hypothetical protein
VVTCQPATEQLNPFRQAFRKDGPSVEIKNVKILLSKAFRSSSMQCDRDASLEFVDLIKASTFGIALWQSACSRYTKVAGQFEPVGVLDGQPKRLSSQDAKLKHQLKHMMCDKAGKEATWLRCV